MYLSKINLKLKQTKEGRDICLCQSDKEKVRTHLVRLRRLAWAHRFCCCFSPIGDASCRARLDSARSLRFSPVTGLRGPSLRFSPIVLTTTPRVPRQLSRAQRSPNQVLTHAARAAAKPLVAARRARRALVRAKPSEVDGYLIRHGQSCRLIT